MGRKNRKEKTTAHTYALHGSLSVKITGKCIETLIFSLTEEYFQ